jgi:hypothetical protein
MKGKIKGPNMNSEKPNPYVSPKSDLSTPPIFDDILTFRKALLPK